MMFFYVQTRSNNIYSTQMRVNDIVMWKDCADVHWHRSQRHQFMCKHKLLTSSLTRPNSF